MLAGGVPITDAQERRILHFFMLFGPWNEEEVPLIVDGELVEVRWRFTPDETHDGGKELLGTLASMYSRLFEYQTTSDIGPVALDIDVEPGTLITLIPHDFDFEAATLPLMLLAASPEESTEGQVARSVAHSGNTRRR